MAEVQIINTVPRFGVEGVGIVLIVTIAYYVSLQPGGIVLAIPLLGTIVMGAQRILPLFQQIYSSISHLHAGHAPLRDTLELLEQPIPVGLIDRSETSLAFERNIELRQISFRYAPSEPQVLRNISLKIQRGSCVGIVGKTASGKSTLLDVIMGLLEPQEGHFYVDGTAVGSSNLRSWQANISHVPQVIFLSDATVAENIALGVPADEIDHNRVREAARGAKIADTIENWKLKYDTFVGERGIRLSGGQRQRIGIARALYKRASVIIFDEATSALDVDTEEEVMRSIYGLPEELTIIIVAHRWSTLKQCDRILELSDGVIVRDGPFDGITQSDQAANR